MSAWLTVAELLPALLLGAVMTVEITAGAFLLAVAIGLAFALLQALRLRGSGSNRSSESRLFRDSMKKMVGATGFEPATPTPPV